MSALSVDDPEAGPWRLLEETEANDCIWQRRNLQHLDGVQLSVVSRPVAHRHFEVARIMIAQKGDSPDRHGFRSTKTLVL